MKKRGKEEGGERKGEKRSGGGHEGERRREELLEAKREKCLKKKGLRFPINN